MFDKDTIMKSIMKVNKASKGTLEWVHLRIKISKDFDFKNIKVISWKSWKKIDTMFWLAEYLSTDEKGLLLKTLFESKLSQTYNWDVFLDGCLRGTIF